MCGDTGTSDTDIRVLCLSHDRPPHGQATTGVGSSGFSAGLVSLPVIHEPSLEDSSGDADSKVDAHPPCPIQIGVCPHSRQTPDLGIPVSQLTAAGSRKYLPKQGRRYSPLIMGQLLRAPSTNA